MTGVFEPFLTAATAQLAGLVVKSVWEMGNLPVDEAAKRLVNNAANAAKSYVENYVKRNGMLKVLEMSKQISLESIYTEVQLVDRYSIQCFESAETIEKRHREKERRGFSWDLPWETDRGKPEKRAGLELANEEQYLMVLGGPGAGKSTFLRRVGLEALKGKRGEFKHSCLPVFLELKRLRDTSVDLEKLILDEFATCGFSRPEEVKLKLLEQGKLLILLDGLDEIATQNLGQEIVKIQDFVDRYNKCRFIASSRPKVYLGRRFRQFTDVAIAEFDDEQIQSFISNWFKSQGKRI